MVFSKANAAPEVSRPGWMPFLEMEYGEFAAHLRRGNKERAARMRAVPAAGSFEA